MPNPAAALAAAKQVDEAIGLIEKLLGKLRAQPDIAALKLSTALDEIVKTYRALDEALNMYGSLALDEDALTANSRELLAIAGGSLAVQVEDGRGHCHQISNIYWKHLRRWFEKAFNRDEHDQMEALFTRLGDADDDLFAALSGLAEQLGSDAKDVLALVIKKEEDKGRQRVLQTYGELAPVQQAMARGMQRMFALKGTFIQISKAA